MRKNATWMLVIASVLVLANTASAVRWPDNMSYRVRTMGGATLGVEDETTALTAFNHQNAAGIAFNKKENRLDLGLVYDVDNTKVTLSGGETKATATDMALIRPGAEYRGLTYWFGEADVLRVGIEGLSYADESTVSITGGGSETEKLSLAGFGGGASWAHVFDFGLALAGGISYNSASGKPDRLDGSYSIYPTTTKYEISASNLNWSGNLAYQLDNLGNDQKLTLGLQVSGDDDMPNLSNLGSVLAVGDYNLTLDMAGTMGPIALTNKTSLINAPLRIAGEIIYDLGSMLSAGLLIDQKSANLTVKSEATQGSTSVNHEYKMMSANLLGITPVVQAILPLGAVNLLPGIQYTTWGTGTADTYDLRSNANNQNDTYKSASTNLSQGVFSLGLGLQALEKQLQVAVQMDLGTSKMDTTPYSSTGVAGTVITEEGSSTRIGVGAEYWVIPQLALRAGYAMLTQVAKDGAVSSTGDPVDLKDISSIITLGAGYAVANSVTLDLLVKLEGHTQDPAPTDTTMHDTMGVFLGTKIPL